MSDASAMLAGVKLPEWAGISGVSRRSAARWLHAGMLPVPAWQLAAGAILAGAPGQAGAGVAVCALVLSCGQRSDLGRQLARLAGYLTAKGIASSKVVCGAGSGRNGHRARVLSLLRDASVGTFMAGHRERLARFGAGYREAALAARGRELIVAGQAGVSGDVGGDMAGVLTGLCAGLYARWPTRHRAELAVAVAGGDRAG